MRAATAPRRRVAVTIPETAFVLSFFLLLLFGIYEYGRLLFTQQVMDAAARESARYAVSVINVDTLSDPNQHLKDYAKKQMLGLDGKLDNFTCTITGIALKDGDEHTTGETFDWKDSGPTDAVSVALSGDFRSVLPKFIFFNKTVTLKSTAVMYSEGN